MFSSKKIEYLCSESLSRFRKILQDSTRFCQDSMRFCQILARVYEDSVSCQPLGFNVAVACRRRQCIILLQGIHIPK